jgi:hypothetical protein
MAVEVTDIDKITLRKEYSVRRGPGRAFWEIRRLYRKDLKLWS